MNLLQGIFAVIALFGLSVQLFWMAIIHGQVTRFGSTKVDRRLWTYLLAGFFAEAAFILTFVQES